MISTNKYPQNHVHSYETVYTDWLQYLWYHKHVIPTNYNDEISSSHIFATKTQERFFQYCLLLFFGIERNLFKIIIPASNHRIDQKCSFYSSNIFLLFRINNKQEIVQTYTCKDLREDINKLFPLTARLWLRNRIH